MCLATGRRCFGDPPFFPWSVLSVFAPDSASTIPSDRLCEPDTISFFAHRISAQRRFRLPGVLRFWTACLFRPPFVGVDPSDRPNDRTLSFRSSNRTGASCGFFSVPRSGRTSIVLTPHFRSYTAPLLRPESQGMPSLIAIFPLLTSKAELSTRSLTGMEYAKPWHPLGCCFYVSPPTLFIVVCSILKTPCCVLTSFSSAPIVSPFPFSPPSARNDRPSWSTPLPAPLIHQIIFHFLPHFSLPVIRKNVFPLSSAIHLHLPPPD